MLVPYSWLKEFVSIKLRAEELALRLTMAGVEVEALKELDNDIVMELGLTPNRGDCLSILGVAVEASAVLGRPFAMPRVTVPKGKGKIQDYLSVEVMDSKSCPRYTARVIDGVSIGPSPSWLVKKLEASSVRSINNVVDATNYVMLEYGQPLHAFDYRDIRGRKICVRCQKTPHKFVTLDGIERQLSLKDLMICDGEGPIAIGGVMGGQNSEVKPDTKVVVLESAYFSPRSIKRTSNRLALSTESSRRFEKGVDPNGVDAALHRLTGLIVELAGGIPTEDWVDKYKNKIRPRRITLSADDVNFLLGTNLNRKEVTFHLTNLGMRVQKGSGKSFNVVVPTRRPDIERPVDLIEEVARLHGYDKVKETMPVITSTSPIIPEDDWVRDAVKDALVGQGFFEVVNYGFCSIDELSCYEGISSDVVRLANPLSAEWQVLKTTLLPGLISNVKRGLCFGESGFKFFELRPVFYSAKGSWPVKEPKRLSGIVYGTRDEVSWVKKEVDADFFDIKGACEAVSKALGVELAFSPHGGRCAYGFLHPQVSADILIAGEFAGFLGRIHPDLQHKLDFEKPVFCFEMDFDKFAKRALARKVVFKELPRFPTVRRDIAFLVEKDMPSSRALEAIKGLKNPLIRHVDVFDVYKGDGVPQGKKSLAYAILYGDPAKTLQDSEVNAVHAMVADQLKRELGAEIR